MDGLNKLPVLILTHNRFDKFLRCITTLYEQGAKNIFVSIDGPVNKNDLKIQKKITSFCIANKLDINITINQFLENNGCRLGPIKGISWFFNKNKYGVVLEDDVIISKKCLELYYRLLNKKNIYNKYMSLSSFNELSNLKIERLYSMPVWRSWGWASWADRWHQHMEFSARINNYSLLKLYRIMPKELRSVETVKLLKACQLNLLDAWDYEFNFTHIVNNLNSLTVGGINNFVYGFDKSATHSFDIDSIGIDFNLFSEREIEEEKIIINSYKKAKLILNKCGFFYSPNINIMKLILQIIRIFYHSIIFRLRIFKRIIYKRL